ncbi:MAG: hypothetical protein P9M02_02275 [Candidatus Susulua stagnicola]|nr:hypothetical protein [Candidatus Susulua stagnicola]
MFLKLTLIVALIWLFGIWIKENKSKNKKVKSSVSSNADSISTKEPRKVFVIIFRIVSGLIILLICFITIEAMLYSSRHSVTVKTAPKDGKYAAWTAAKLIITQRLPYPTTVKFPPYNPKLFEQSGNHQYSIYSYVDFENSFGVIVRREFIAKIGKTDTHWIIKHISWGRMNQIIE